MDWQQVASLAIVAVTVGLFVGNRFRQRKLTFAQATHCGCSSAGQSANKNSITISGRRGERPKVIVKM
jgi:hypothetical protein